MEVVVTTGAIRHAELQLKCHHQQTNMQFFLQARCPSYCPTNSVKALFYSAVPPPLLFGRICFVVLVVRKGGEAVEVVTGI